MPDYQTSEGMAVEVVSKLYNRDVRKLKKALTKIYKLCCETTACKGSDEEEEDESVDYILLKIEDIAEKALGLNRKHGFR